MKITTVMVIILIAWCLLTIFVKGYQPVPAPIPANLHFNPEALGWLKGTIAPSITFIAILIGLGHSLLAMSGEETLGQVNREIEAPKLKNLERTGFVIFVYSLLFTALVSFFSVMIIPDAVRSKYLDNLIGGLSMFLVGPTSLRLLFQAFVVLVGILILSGSVNTSIVGSNGVLNRVAEDGVLTDWFRHPHPRYGTTHRLINLIVILQIATIIISRGDVYMLGEGYAFGVVWSFVMKSLAVLILRFKEPEGRGWKVPLNFRIGNTEIPVGLAIIFLALFSIAIVNFLTKKVATISGVSFSLAFFTMLQLSEMYNRKKNVGHPEESERFCLDARDDLSQEALQARPGNILVTARNPQHLEHLKEVLEKTDTEKISIVVLSVHPVTKAGSGEHTLEMNQIFSQDETELFSKVVTLAEKAGKHVELLVVAGTDLYKAIVQTAQLLQSSQIVTALSPHMDPTEQGRMMGEAWEQLPQPRPSLSLEIVKGDGQSVFFNLGPHPPRLWPEDIDLVHKLWLELCRNFGSKLHHRDVVGTALRRLEQDLHSNRAGSVIEEMKKEIEESRNKGEY